MSATSDRIRREFKEADDIRDAGFTTPDEVIRFDDLLYGTEKEWQVLDVYRPRNAENKKLPIIVSVHGGGWVYGDKERYQYYCMELAKRGFAVVNFTYRLAPEFKHPAPLEDTALVMKWILEHKEEYGFDTKYVFAVGDSAGGNLLGLYAAICTNEAYAKRFSFQAPKEIKLTAVALNCGDYKVEASADEFEQTNELMKDYLPHQGTEAELREISVPDHVTPDYPPTFLMTATGDFLKDQALLMAEKLSACNVPFVYRLYGDGRERLPHVFHCDIHTEAANLCNDEECEFFRKFVK